MMSNRLASSSSSSSPAIAAAAAAAAVVLGLNHGRIQHSALVSQFSIAYRPVMRHSVAPALITLAREYKNDSAFRCTVYGK